MNLPFGKKKSLCSAGCRFDSPHCLSIKVEPEIALRRLKSAGEGSLMMKTAGLTLLRKMALGDFYQQSGFLLDPIGGLQFFEDELELVLFRCPLLGCLRVAMMTLEGRILAYLSFEKLEWEGVRAESLKKQLGGEPRGNAQDCLSGCRKWLDDWSGEAPKSRRPYDRLHLVSAMSSCQQIQVKFSDPLIKCDARFYPGRVDVDGEILRISDHTRRSIVFVDMGLIDISFSCEKALISA